MRWFSGSPRTTPAAAVDVPPGLPVLEAGRHRSARAGACFMEWASLLAGERFTDHPACTHPLLAHLARMVNDATTDAGRRQLAPLVPSVVGLTSEDPRWAYDVAVAAALVALPLATAEDRKALAAGILTCERLRSMHPADDGAAAPPLPHRPHRADLTGRRTARDVPVRWTAGDVRPSTRAALETEPEATAWAEAYIADLVSLRAMHDPAAVLAEHAVVVVVRRGEDTDAVLARMLRDAIAAVRSTAGVVPAVAAGASPRPVRTGVSAR
jgi:hypothetical protein